MNRNRRVTGAVSRLTYTAPGVQTERQGFLGVASTQANNPTTVTHSEDTVEGLEYWIAFHKKIISQSQLELHATQTDAETFGNQDQDSMTAEEWENWQKILVKRNNATVCLKMSNERVRESCTKLDHLKKIQQVSTVPAAGGASSYDNSASGNGNTIKLSMASTSGKRSSRGSISTKSSASTMKRRADLEAKNEIAQLRHKIEDDVGKLDEMIADLQLRLPASQDKASVEVEIASLENKKASALKTLQNKERQINERLALVHEEIDLEFEEDQVVGPDDNLLPPPPVSSYVNSWMGTQPPLEYSKLSHYEPSYGAEQRIHAEHKDGNDGIPNDWSGFGFAPPKPVIQEPAVNSTDLPGDANPNFSNQNHGAAKEPQEFADRYQDPGSSPREYGYIERGHSEGNPINELVSAFKVVAQELKGDKAWEPKDLPVYDGKPGDWPIFYNEFQRTTPQGKTNSSQNLIRLRKSLQSEAKDAVQGLLHEPQNVQKIIRILQTRFGRPELIIRTLIEKADNCKGPDIFKPESFVTFGTAVQHLVETVRSMREDRYLNDMTLLDKLVSKLPTPQAKDWLSFVQIHREKIKNLQLFGEWVDEEMEKNVQLITTSPADNSKKARGKRGSVKVNAVTTEEPKKKESRDACAYCDMTNHHIRKCFKFRDIPLEEKVKYVKEKGLCFLCLASGHLKKDCSSSIKCSEKDCKIDHNPLLHSGGKQWRSQKKPAKDKDSHENNDEGRPDDFQESMTVFKVGNSDSGKTESNIGAVVTQQSKPISIVRIRVRGPKGIKRTYGLMDSGSDTTVILSELAKQLGIEGKSVQSKCHVVGGKSFKVLSQEVDFEVAGAYKSAKFYKLKEALTMDTVGLSKYTQNADEVKKKWSYLRRAKLDSFEAVTPMVIMGEDNPFVTAHREILQRNEHEPMAKRTHLGWVLAGKIKNKEKEISINAASFQEDENLDNILKASLNIDSYGVYQKDSTGSVEDKRALEVLQNTVRKAGESQWECGLLWRDENVQLPPSRDEAVSRLLKNEQRMKRNPEYAEMYHNKIDEYLKKGYIRMLTEEEARRRTDKTLYIPHFGVYNVNKPGKLRLVFDAACRGGGVSLNQHLMTGPDLLRPKNDVKNEDLEMRASFLNATQISSKEQKEEPTVKMENFSRYNVMLRAQCAVVRAAEYWIGKIRKLPVVKPWTWKNGKLTSYYSPPEIERAEYSLVRKVQREVFNEDLSSLEKKDRLPQNSKLWKLSVFVDTMGILRTNGRFKEAAVPQDMKTPILLPSRHQFTELLIMQEHIRSAHQGQAGVLNTLRKRYWILEGRSAIRRTVDKCLVCRLRNAKPIIPRMGDLPYYRLAAGCAPFSYTGVDLMGPVEVVVGRHHEKRWIAVFTCMVTRAVHLEVVHGLSTDETMMALSRFVDQRGRPQHLYSDNGTNFVGAKAELQKSWSEIDWPTIMNTDKFREIRWQFSPPCSPHFGGAWERMVKEVKKILKKTMFEKFPKDPVLLTMIKGAENIINSRPITYVSNDPTDPEALTPNHFLRGFTDFGPNLPGEYSLEDEVARAQWRRAQGFVEHFWSRWTKEALPELMRRDKWHGDAEPLAVGDIVLLVDDQAPRNTWQKGVIVETFPGKDDQVRVVRVETSDFRTKTRKSYKRGVDKIVPLGLRM